MTSDNSLLVIYEDNHVLAAIKKPGVLSQADASGRPDMVNLIKDYLVKSRAKPGKAWLGLVHRLDQPASGLMIFALTSKAADRLSEAFRNNLVGKYYLALVKGKPKETGGEFRDYLSLDRINGRYYAVTSTAGKEAALEYKVLFSLTVADEPLSFVLIELITGRPHQIRVQFSLRNLPLLGDRRYGQGSELDQRVPTLALHSYRMDFIHPVRKEKISLTAPLLLAGENLNPSFDVIDSLLNYPQIDCQIDLMAAN
ncbi:MAG: RluA family pseudouridine synthase [Saccharofermentanales bacterium]|jgi:23S rRNA pseudouridine1911/1915/1917 synthase|nr:RNA pseudouridine synthase [Bacillota bacterium]NLB08403.1 RNA pseudouridine synthase [Clostridiales bacterium]